MEAPSSTPAPPTESQVVDETPVSEGTVGTESQPGAATSGAATQSEAPDPLLAELSKSLGEDFSGVSRDDVLRDLIDARQLREEQQRWQAERAYLQAQVVRQTQAAPPAPQQPAAPSGWSKPEFNPEWMNHVKQDENGNIVPIGPYVDPAIVRGVQQYRDWRRQNSERLVEDPRGFLLETVGLKSDLEKLVEEKITAARQQWEMQQQAVQAQSTVFEELSTRGYFVAGTDKQPLRDRDGQLVPTESGKQFFAAVERVMAQYGIADETKAMQLALEIHKPAAPPAKPTPLSTLSKGTNRIASRRPTLANGAPVEQAPPRSFVQECMEAMSGLSN